MAKKAKRLSEADRIFWARSLSSRLGYWRRRERAGTITTRQERWLHKLERWSRRRKALS